MKTEKKLVLLNDVYGRRPDCQITAGKPNAKYGAIDYEADNVASATQDICHIEVPSMVLSGLPWALKIENAEMCAEKGTRPRNHDMGSVYVDFELYWDGDGNDELRKEFEKRLPELILESQQELLKQFPNILHDSLAQWYGRERSTSRRGRGM